MRRETKVRALQRLIDCQRTQQRAEDAASAAAGAIAAGGAVEVAERGARAAWEARREFRAAEDVWRSMPREQREYSTASAEAGIGLAKLAAVIGGQYSGTVTYSGDWGSATTASTSTDRGEQYSRRCTYRRVNADHRVMITPEGMVDLIESPSLAQASGREGLPMLAYVAAAGGGGGAAVWVERKGKTIRAVEGWIAEAGGTIYHSTESLDHARRGAARKAAAAAREADRRRADTRAARRASLVVRLCRGAVATVADAKAAGYCEAGIRSWQERHGIGDAAPLAELVRTGDALATRLAFDLARRVRRGEPATAGA
jgi:hypothetical protein